MMSWKILYDYNLIVDENFDESHITKDDKGNVSISREAYPDLFNALKSRALDSTMNFFDTKKELTMDFETVAMLDSCAMEIVEKYKLNLRFDHDAKKLQWVIGHGNDFTIFSRTHAEFDNGTMTHMDFINSIKAVCEQIKRSIDQSPALNPGAYPFHKTRSDGI